MNLLIPASNGNTPLSPEELAELIPNLATKEELNEWERENILSARVWALRARTTANDIVRDEYIRKLHKQMFGQTWKWAGRYRRTDKNIGIPFPDIPEQLGVLCGDVRYWIDHATYSIDEIAVRYHHRLVFIHPFPNGNGRHGRLVADLLVMRLGRPVFTWGSSDLVKPDVFRERYLEAIRTADMGDIRPILEFARA
jgi:Fic-DOC domain mobile mystery protein B